MKKSLKLIALGMLGSTLLFGGNVYADGDGGNGAGKSMKTFYNTRGRNIERNGFKTIGEITYEACFTSGIVKGKCPSTTLYVQTYQTEYGSASDHTCKAGTTCDSISRLVEAKEKALDELTDREIRNFSFRQY